MSGYGIFEKIKISHHLAVFSVFRLTSRFPVTGSDQNPYQATISMFVYALKESLGKYLVWGGRDGAPLSVCMKKTHHFSCLTFFIA